MLRGPTKHAPGGLPDEAAQLLAQLFDRSPLGALSLDGEGRILRANAACAGILGSSVAALEGRLIASHQSDAAASTTRAAIAAARSGVAPAPFEVDFARVDGSIASCRVHLAPILDADGLFAYALASVLDLSQTVAAEATLRESEERARTLFELSPDAVLFFVAGRVAHANPAAVRLLAAKDLAALLGRRSTDLVAPAGIPEVERRAAALMAGESVPALEETYLRLDGTPLEVETTASRVPHAAGKAFVVILRDIRDRKESEERARKEREAHAASVEARERELWLREIVDLLPSCVYARDPTGRLVLANRAFAGLVGLTPREVVGRTFDDLGVPAEVAAATFAMDRAVLAAGRPTVVHDEVFVDPAGRCRTFETSRLPFAVGGQATVLCVSTDVTERERLEVELREAHKLEAIGRLAGGIAHDFNNLLTVIVASAEELAAQRTAPDADLGRILSVASRATALTQQLLAFARKSPFEERELALNDVVEDMVSLLARVLGEEIAIATDLDPSAGAVRVDRRSIDRVLMNLAVNARDAMPGGGKLTFSTRTVPAPGGGPEPWCALSIADTGAGMSEETRRHLFEPFYTTKATGEGTGLGLATCFGIVQQARGRIEVVSELGVGTTFRVLLPAVALPLSQPAPSAPAASAPPLSAPLGDETILLLDDDALVRSATARVLRRLGYSVLVAATPAEALALARTPPTRIDMLLTDVVMPGMSGPQTVNVIRESLPGLPVLYVTGYSRDALAFTDESLHVLAKPYSRYDLASKLREVLAPSRAAASAGAGPPAPSRAP
jgi:two-component system cell cycle sensor histidine kinase/response regulator CckA